MGDFRKKLQVLKACRSLGLFSLATHLTEREKLLLFELSKNLTSNAVVVEVGSYLGASTCFLAAGASQKSGTVYAVDTWTNVAMSEGPRDTFEEFMHSIKPLRKWIVPLRGLSTAIAQQFNEEQIDLLFIDGDHSYEAVRSDLEAWLPKLKNRGTVVLHDYNWASGVRQAVRELVVPIQIEGGQSLDGMYWARIEHDERRVSELTPPVSVIVPTYNRPSYLSDTLGSLFLQDYKADQYEIVVVDNKPTGEVFQIIKDLQSQCQSSVRCLEETDVGLHKARHAGAKAAVGEILIYIDDDVVMEKGWLQSISKPFADQRVAIVGGKVLPKWEAETPKWLAQFPSTYLSLLDLGEERRELEWPEGVYGCNMAVRRTALYEVGGFNPDAMGDPRFIWLRGDGETGLHKKIYDAGYKVIYEPQASAYHRVSASRLQPEYFYWRAFIQGISDSYTHMRNSRSPVVRIFSHAARCMSATVRAHVRSLLGSRERIHSRAQAHYWYGRARHQLRMALSPTLRSHVLRETYLE